MAVTLQILLSCLFFAIVYSHRKGTHSHDHSYGDGGPRPSTLPLNPIHLLEAAAQLTYPITNGLNNAIGSIGGLNNIPDDIPVPQGPPGMNGIRYSEGNARNALAFILRYLGIHHDHHFHDSYESRSSETNSGEDFPNNKPDVVSSEYDDDDNYSEIDEDHDALFTDSIQPSIFSRNPAFSNNNRTKPIALPEQPPTDIDSIDDKNKREAEFQAKTSVVVPPSSINNIAPNPAVSSPAVLPNLPNQGYFIVPISSSNANRPNPIIDGVTGVPSGGIINMHQPSVISNPASVNGNAPGNVFVPNTGSSQPNLIYTIMNPNNANPSSNAGKPTLIPIFVNNDAQTNPGSSSANVYYFVPNSDGTGISFSPGTGGPGGIPASFTPTIGASSGKTPFFFVPASGGSSSNSPVTFLPGNGNAGGNIPVSFVPSNAGSGFGSFVPASGTSNGNSFVVYVPANGRSGVNSPINFGSGYLIPNKAADDTASASNSDASEQK